jgi:diguanylate cyclase (GGDEF)-like protein
VSIGIATYPDHAATIPELLDIADAAMYAAKRSGRSTYRFGRAPVIDPSNVLRLTR